MSNEKLLVKAFVQCRDALAYMTRDWVPKRTDAQIHSERIITAVIAADTALETAKTQTPCVWHVVSDADDEKDLNNPRAAIWTLSTNPKEAGWDTDAGFYGYGLRKDVAEFLATAANEKLARERSGK